MGNKNEAHRNPWKEGYCKSLVTGAVSFGIGGIVSVLTEDRGLPGYFGLNSISPYVLFGVSSAVTLTSFVAESIKIGLGQNNERLLASKMPNYGYEGRVPTLEEAHAFFNTEKGRELRTLLIKKDENLQSNIRKSRDLFSFIDINKLHEDCETFRKIEAESGYDQLMRHNSEVAALGPILSTEEQLWEVTGIANTALRRHCNFKASRDEIRAVLGEHACYGGPFHYNRHGDLGSNIYSALGEYLFFKKDNCLEKDGALEIKYAIEKCRNSKNGLKQIAGKSKAIEASDWVTRLSQNFVKAYEPKSFTREGMPVSEIKHMGADSNVKGIASIVRANDFIPQYTEAVQKFITDESNKIFGKDVSRAKQNWQMEVASKFYGFQGENRGKNALGFSAYMQVGINQFCGIPTIDGFPLLDLYKQAGRVSPFGHAITEETNFGLQVNGNPKVNKKEAEALLNSFKQSGIKYSTADLRTGRAPNFSQLKLVADKDSGLIFTLKEGIKDDDVPYFFDYPFDMHGENPQNGLFFTSLTGGYDSYDSRFYPSGSNLACSSGLSQMIRYDAQKVLPGK